MDNVSNFTTASCGFCATARLWCKITALPKPR